MPKLKKVDEAQMELDSMAALEALVLRANRFVSRVAESDSFRERKVGVAEWLALRALQRSGKETFTSLARTLGVTRQRVKQIADSLKASGLVRVSSSDDDRRKAEVAITPAGEALLQQLESGLRGKLNSYRGGLQPAVRAGNVMHRLTRLLGSAEAANQTSDDHVELELATANAA